MKDVLRTLEKNQTVILLYRGKVLATIVPAGNTRIPGRVRSHPFFGMYSNDKADVTTIMQYLRGERFGVVSHLH
jgi:hypothetical protein